MGTLWESSCASRMRSISASVRYSVSAAAGRGTVRRSERASAKLTFASRRILFSEESFEQIVPDVNGFFFSLLKWLALIKRQGFSDVYELPYVAAECYL